MNDDHERRITRMEHVLFGPDEATEKGMVSRFMMTESIAVELKGYAVKLIALMVTGIVVALLNLVIVSSRPSQSGNGSTQSTSVITSDASRAADLVSRKEWLTVQDVAAREGLDEHTITNYIAREQIQPSPVKAGKSYQISPAYRIIPNSSEPSRTVANSATAH